MSKTCLITWKIIKVYRLDQKQRPFGRKSFSQVFLISIFIAIRDVWWCSYNNSFVNHCAKYVAFQFISFCPYRYYDPFLFQSQGQDHMCNWYALEDFLCMSTRLNKDRNSPGRAKRKKYTIKLKQRDKDTRSSKYHPNLNSDEAEKKNWVKSY